MTAPRITLEEVRAEIAQLSPEEQQAAHADLYGEEVEQRPETEDFVQIKLDEFHHELEQIQDKRTAYDTAVEKCPDYVKDRDFELIFLRADSFDAKVRERPEAVINP